MPILFEIDHASQFVHARTHGVVSLQDILDYMDAVTIQDAAAYPKLFDATDGDLQLSDDDMMALGARVSAYAAYDPRGPVAAVAVSEKPVALIRRFMNLGGAQRSMRLFSSAREARAWLER